MGRGWGNARNRTKPKSSEYAHAVSGGSVEFSDVLKRLGMSWYDYQNSDTIGHKQAEAIRAEMEGEKQRKITKLNAVGDVFQLADRVLAQRDVNVRITTDSVLEAPAWSDGTNMFLNAHIIDDPTDENLVALRGINYHELGHIIYTPRAGSELVKTVIDEKLWSAMNTLEDNRVETYVTALYPATIPYLTTMFLRYVIDNMDSENPTIGGAFVLSRGRKFLPLQLRQAIADSFITEHGVEHARAIAEIIDEYRLLVLPRQADRALELIRQFAELTGMKGDRDQDGGYMTSQCSDHPPMKNGRPASTKEQDEMAKRISQADSKSESEKLNGTSSKGAGQGEQKSSDDVSRQERNSDELVDEINKLIKETISNPDTKKDIQNLRNVMRDGGGSGERVLKQADYESRTVEVSDSVIAEQFAEELQRLQIDSDPQWEYEVPSGRINIQRVMNFDPTKIGTAFDRWGEGNDGVFDMDVAILVDNSGSMARDMREALRSTWIIKRALDSINADSIVYSFSTTCRVLYDRGEQATRNTYRAIWSENSTDPTDALFEVERFMMASQRRTKMVYIVTDGYWDYPEKCDNIIKRLQDMGVIVVILYIGDVNDINPAINPEKYKSVHHGADIFHAISKPTQIVGLAQDIVRHLATTRR